MAFAAGAPLLSHGGESQQYFFRQYISFEAASFLTSNFASVTEPALNTPPSQGTEEPAFLEKAIVKS
jgi:hypothetical protein